MKKFLEKIAGTVTIVFGYGILICLLTGGLSFAGYLAALCIGGDAATAICTFIYKSVYPVLVICTTSLIFVGLIPIYIKEAQKKGKDCEKARSV